METFEPKDRKEKNTISSPPASLLFSLLLAVPVFFVFVYLLGRAGYDVFDFSPYNLFPSIPIYLGDFSLCFSSRLLLGSITKLFSYQLTLPQLYNICCTMNIIALSVSALICGRMLVYGITKKSFPVLFVTLLAVLNPVVSQEYYPAIGTYDTYWIVLFGILILLVNADAFAVLAPFVCFTGMMVHYGFMFSYLPAVVALLLYAFFTTESKKKKILNGVSFCLTGVASVFVIVYSFLFSGKNLSMTGEEFHEYLLSRLKLTGVEEIRLKRLFGDNLFPFRFFEIYFFNNVDSETELNDISPQRYLELFLGYLKDSTDFGYYLTYAALLVPFMIVFVLLWVMCMRRVSGIQKLPYLCFALIQLVFFVACILSTDIYRWGATLIISQLTLTGVMLKKKDNAVTDVLSLPLLRNPVFIVISLVLGAVLVVFMFKTGVHLPRTADV